MERYKLWCARGWCGRGMEDEGERAVDVGFGGRVEMAAVVMVVIVVVVVVDCSWGGPAAGRH